MNAPLAANRITHRGLTTAALMTLMALSAVEATVVSTAMPTVIADLGGVALYGWVAAAYFLTVTVATPIYGKLADTVGRKPVALASVALFLVGSFACGAAGSIGWLIAARALQGIGAGGMQPVTLTIIGDLYPLEERGKVQGAMSGVWATASVVGPLLGGWIVHAASWRWVFWVNIPVGLLGVAVLLRAYHEPARARAGGAVDLPGATLFTAATVALLLGVHGTAPALTLPVALFAALAFVRVETRAEDPMLPLALLRERVIAATSGSGLILGAAMMTSLVMLPLFAQGALRLSPTQAGSSVAPMLFGWPLAAFLTSRVLARVGPRAPMVLGSLLIAAALAALARALGPAVSIHTLQAWMLVYGLGMGMVSTASLLAVQSAVPWSRRGGGDGGEPLRPRHRRRPGHGGLRRAAGVSLARGGARGARARGARHRGGAARDRGAGADRERGAHPRDGAGVRLPRGARGGEPPGGHRGAADPAPRGVVNEFANPRGARPALTAEVHDGDQGFVPGGQAHRRAGR
jgi:EmrB/QacA subfamily drug resistance transporter